MQLTHVDQCPFLSQTDKWEEDIHFYSKLFELLKDRWMQILLQLQSLFHGLFIKEQ